jgi:hypothetical protein
MEHEAEPGWTGAAGQDAAGRAASDSGGPESGAPDIAGSDSSRSDSAVPAAPAEQPTGEPRVDAALKLLDRLPGLPVSEHSELFEQVHAQLSEVLGELESGPGTAGLGRD